MNGHSTIDTNHATQFLKDILNVGKSDAVGGRSNSISMEGNADTVTDIQHGEVLKPTMPKQQIVLAGNDKDFSFGINAQDVTIFPSPPVHNTGSSKVKVHNVVDFSWEQKSYSGRLVGVHLSGNYLAYSIKVYNNKSGMVRVLKPQTGDRTLVKGMTGEVKDLAFSHSTTDVLLACVDEIGSLYVTEIAEKDGALVGQCVLQILQPSNTPVSDYHRLIWCPYIPEEACSLDDDNTADDVSKLLVITHNEEAEIINIDIVTKEYGSGELLADEVDVGVQKISKHNKPIIDAALSPDGTALATASIDGDVKFFQVYVPDKNTSPRCLHQWDPHDGKALSCLFFLDNHKNPNPDVQFWKFAITGAENNQVLKLWSCETWTCLQTIRFVLTPGDNVKIMFKAELDLSSSYLLLSDINRKVLYIMQIHQEPTSSQACICSISEFLLTHPILSFAITDVSRCKYKPSNDIEHIESTDHDDKGDFEADEVGGSEKYVEGNVVKLFWIHAKQLQECRIVYQPVLPVPIETAGSVASLSQDSFGYNDKLCDLSLEVREVPKSTNGDNIPPSLLDTAVPQSAVLTPSVRSPLSSHLQAYKSCGEILLTPDDFASPPSVSTIPPVSTFSHSPLSIPISSIEEVKQALSPPKPPENKCEENETTEMESSEPLPDSSILPRRKSSQHSSTSSPSREVAEIMAPSKILNSGEQEEEEEEQGLEEQQHNNISVEAALLKNTNELCNHSTAIDNSSVSDVARAHPEYSANGWPQAPDPTKEYRMVGRDEREGDMQDINENQHSHSHESSKEVYSSNQLGTEGDFVLRSLETSLHTLEQNMNTLVDLLHSQRHQVQEIKQDMEELQHNKKILQCLLQHVDKLEDKLNENMERTIAAHTQTEFSKLEALCARKEKIDQQWLEKQAALLSQTVITAVNSKLDRSIKSEIKNSILPYVSKFLDVLKDQLQQDVAQKLTSTDNIIRESIGKLSKNKMFSENLGQCVVSMVQPYVQTTCRDVFQSTTVPAFEKACQNLFYQLNDSFQRGTEEYLQHVEKSLERNRHHSESSTEKTIGEVHEQLSQFQASVEQMIRNSLTVVHNQMLQHLEKSEKQQGEMLEKMKSMIQEEVKSAISEHQLSLKALQSNMMSPIPQTLDPQVQQQQIKELLHQGQINSAFQQALSASDLNLVTFVCETVHPKQVFGRETCPLQQPVLLSLIQQLSGDLSTQAELKLNYLEEAVMNLDTSDTRTQQHLPTILGGLHNRLSLYIQNNPTSKISRHKMLVLAIQSILHQ